MVYTLTELIFDGMIVCFMAFTLKHFVFSSCVGDMNDLLDDCFGCHSKVFSASSVE